MKHLVLTLVCTALLALTVAPLAHAAEVTPESCTQAPLSLDPTEGAVPMDDFMGCAEEDLESTSFFMETDPQVCVDYCTNNGWSFLSYEELGRGYYICFCCSA